MKNKPLNQLPPPGSEEAGKLGCTCPTVDNFYGRGWMGNPGMYVYNEDCPLHAEEIKLITKTLDDRNKTT